MPIKNNSMPISVPEEGDTRIAADRSTQSAATKSEDEIRDDLIKVIAEQYGVSPDAVLTETAKSDYRKVTTDMTKQYNTTLGSKYKELFPDKQPLDDSPLTVFTIPGHTAVVHTIAAIAEQGVKDGTISSRILEIHGDHETARTNAMNTYIRNYDEFKNSLVQMGLSEDRADSGILLHYFARSYGANATDVVAALNDEGML